MLPRQLKHKYGVWTYGQGFIPARDFCLKKKKFDSKIASSSDSNWQDSQTWEANQTSLSKLNEKLINKRWCDDFYNTQPRSKDTAGTIQININKIKNQL